MVKGKTICFCIVIIPVMSNFSLRSRDYKRHILIIMQNHRYLFQENVYLSNIIRHSSILHWYFISIHRCDGFLINIGHYHIGNSLVYNYETVLYNLNSIFSPISIIFHCVQNLIVSEKSVKSSVFQCHLRVSIEFIFIASNEKSHKTRLN